MVKKDNLAKPVGVPRKNPENGKMWIKVDISNDAIRFIKSAVQMYEGDKDDRDNQETKEEVRRVIHELWKQLNPS